MKPQGPREAPISFRPGKLRAAIRPRARGPLTEGQIAKRDLGRYYLLLSEALAGIKLTTYEGRVLARLAWNEDVRESFSGDPFIPEHRNPSEYLLQLVKNEVSSMEQVGDTPSPRLYGLADKVEKMTTIERAAVLDAIDRLPGDSEEQFGNPNDWQLIGVYLVEQPLTVDDVVRH